MNPKLPKFVTSRAKLGEILGGSVGHPVHRDTIARWEKMEGAPVCGPRGYDVKQWIDFAAMISKRSGVAPSSTKAEKEMEKLSEVVRGLKLKNDEDEKMLMLASTVKETITTLVSELNGHIRTIEDALPQSMQGHDIPAQRLIIRGMFDVMRAKINKGTGALL